MVIKYNQQCKRCRKNYVLVTGKNKFPLCYECQKKELRGKITNKKMKKLFDIPLEFYKENQFLRNIKIYYLKYKELSEKQIKSFKETVENMKKDAKSTKKRPK